MPYSPIIQSRQQISVNPIYTTEGGWNPAPTNLNAIDDNNDNTSTTYGTIGGSLQLLGYWNIDIGLDINLPYSALQWKIAIQNSNNNHAYWGLEYQSLDSGEWVNVWGVHRQAPSSGDTIITREIVIPSRWRRLRFLAKDTGSYSALIKIYFVRVFSL